MRHRAVLDIFSKILYFFSNYLIELIIDLIFDFLFINIQIVFLLILLSILKQNPIPYHIL